MWRILEKRAIKKALKKAPRSVLLRYEAWKRILELQGPPGLRAIKGFHDEALAGKWIGFRSSRLGLQWRVIYKVEQRYFAVHVFEVNAHEY